MLTISTAGNVLLPASQPVKHPARLAIRPAATSNRIHTRGPCPFFCVLANGGTRYDNPV